MPLAIVVVLVLVLAVLGKGKGKGGKMRMRRKKEKDRHEEKGFMISSAFLVGLLSTGGLVSEQVLARKSSGQMYIRAHYAHVEVHHFCHPLLYRIKCFNNLFPKQIYLY